MSSKQSVMKVVCVLLFYLYGSMRKQHFGLELDTGRLFGINKLCLFTVPLLPVHLGDCFHYAAVFCSITTHTSW